MKKRILCLGVLIGCGAVSAVLAQSVAEQDWGLDIEAIEARTARQADDAQALFDYATARGESQRESAQETIDAGHDAAAGLDVSDIGGADGPIDLDAMLAGARANMAEPQAAPLFIAFASLSMPEEALERLIADTSRAGGVVVFRGFSAGDPKNFAAGIARVVERQNAGNLAIDPRLFRSFAVDRVPTFVALSSGFQPCDQLDCVTAPPPHDRIAGNVSIAYVLETFAEANGPGAPVARTALANLTQRP